VAIAWGLLSTAHINLKVLAGARGSDRVRVLAVASRDGARAEAFAREHGIPRAHGSYEALLADPDVDAVYIPLPNSLHVEWTLRALEAGKHVLIEKPFSRWPGEVERAFDAADRAGLLLSEAFMWRHHPQTARLLELIDDGAIGRLQHIRAAFAFDLMGRGDETDIRLQADLEGGALMDVGCYCVSGIRLLAGEPERIHAEAVMGPSGVDLRLAGTLRLAGDVVGQFDCAFTTQHRDELEAIGTEGTLFLDDPWHCRRPGIELRRADGVERIEIGAADPYRLELEDLSDAIRDGGRPRLGREDALGQARVIEALYRSAETGLPVDPRSAASAG
jgi:predicted dehydrogenase